MDQIELGEAVEGAIGLQFRRMNQCDWRGAGRAGGGAAAMSRPLRTTVLEAPPATTISPSSSRVGRAPSAARSSRVTSAGRLMTSGPVVSRCWNRRSRPRRGRFR